MLDSTKFYVHLLVSDLPFDAFDLFPRRSRRLTQITSQKVWVYICVICVICGQRWVGGGGMEIQNLDFENQNSKAESVEFDKSCGDFRPGSLERFLGNRTGVRSQDRVDHDIEYS